MSCFSPNQLQHSPSNRQNYFDDIVLDRLTVDDNAINVPESENSLDDHSNIRHSLDMSIGSQYRDQYGIPKNIKRKKQSSWAARICASMTGNCLSEGLKRCCEGISGIFQ